MSDGMGREFTYLSSHATNRYFIPNWGNTLRNCRSSTAKGTLSEQEGQQRVTSSSSA